jgi:hypothetical protein
MKLQQWKEARIWIAAFIETVMQQTEGRMSLLGSIHNLAMICEQSNWLEEAEQLLIMEVIWLERTGSAKEEIMEERMERIVGLMQQQGKSADQIVFDPSAILSRAKNCVEQGVDG